MADRIDPVAEVINDIVKSARHYNGFQPHFEVELDQDRLLSELKECVDITLADARLLYSVVPVSGGARPMPRLLQIVLDPTVPEPGWRVGFRSIAGYRWYELEDKDANMIQLVMLDPVKARGGGRVREVMDELRRPAGGRTGGTWLGPLDSLLAELLGYEDDSVRLVFP